MAFDELHRALQLCVAAVALRKVPRDIAYHAIAFQGNEGHTRRERLLRVVSSLQVGCCPVVGRPPHWIGGSALHNSWHVG